jgi:ABC-type multidrug transport system ATPase subunit
VISISINNLGKKFNREWIFRGLNCQIAAGEKFAILGGNGSGKSTLLQVISGFISPNEGEVVFDKSGNKIEPDELKDHISFASPYLQLVEDFTLTEMIEHAAVFKPFISHTPVSDIVKIIELQNTGSKPIKQFSSGMKQRLKLGLAILADSRVLLLDEPVSNLDKNAIAWYKQMIADYTGTRTVIVCSNAIRDEYSFCGKELNVMDYKLK